MTNLISAHNRVAGDVGREAARLGPGEGAGEEGDGRGDLFPRLPDGKI